MERREQQVFPPPAASEIENEMHVLAFVRHIDESMLLE